MATAIIILVLWAIVASIGWMVSTGKYNLAKLIDKTHSVHYTERGPQRTFRFKVLHTLDEELRTKTITVSETVYYKFNEGDYLTIRV